MCLLLWLLPATSRMWSSSRQCPFLLLHELNKFFEKRFWMRRSKRAKRDAGVGAPEMSDGNEETFVYYLPPELIRLVLDGLWEGSQCLSSVFTARRCIQDLLHASCTCKTWNFLIEEGWEPLFLSYFSEADLQVLAFSSS